MMIFQNVRSGEREGGKLFVLTYLLVDRDIGCDFLSVDRVRRCDAGIFCADDGAFSLSERSGSGGGGGAQ